MCGAGKYFEGYTGIAPKITMGVPENKRILRAVISIIVV